MKGAGVQYLIVIEMVVRMEKNVKILTRRKI